MWIFTGKNAFNFNGRYTIEKDIEFYAEKFMVSHYDVKPTTGYQKSDDWVHSSELTENDRKIIDRITTFLLNKVLERENKSFLSFAKTGYSRDVYTNSSVAWLIDKEKNELLVIREKLGLILPVDHKTHSHLKLVEKDLDKTTQETL